MRSVKIMLSIFLVFTLVLCSSAITSVSAGDTSSMRNQIYNRISPELLSMIDNRMIEETDVVIWLKGVSNEKLNKDLLEELRSAEILDFVNYELPKLGVMDIEDENYTYINELINKYITIKRNVNSRNIQLYNNDFINLVMDKFGRNIKTLYCSSLTPMLVLKIPTSLIYSIAGLEQVSFIYLFEMPSIDEVFEESVLQQAQNTNYYGVWKKNTNINTTQNAQHLTGNGVKVGLIQNHVPDFDYYALPLDMQTRLNELFDYSLTHNLLHNVNLGWETTGDIDHANYMLSIITGYINGEYSGIAPYADVYCAGYDSTDGIGYFQPIEELISNGVNVICASIAMGATNNQYDFNARFLDYLISHYDVSICISTGNSTITSVHNGALAYNAISVGNINDNQTYSVSDDILEGSSNYSSFSNSPYKPDICAPGTFAKTYSHPDINGGGTSASAAILTGVSALMMQSNPSLKTNPTLLKAALLASSKNLPNMTDIYSTASSIEPAMLHDYGTGMVDSATTYLELYNSQTYSYNSTSSQETEFTYNIKVRHQDVNAGRDIFLSLVWMNLVDQETITDSYYDNENYTVYPRVHHKLELYDPDGILVACSDYSYDTKQFIRYKPLQYGEYCVKITRNLETDSYFPVFSSGYYIK